MIVVEYFHHSVFEKFLFRFSVGQFHFKYDAFAAIPEESQKMIKYAELQIVKAESAKERKM